MNQIKCKNNDFIAKSNIETLLSKKPPDKFYVRDIIKKSLTKNALNVHETSALLLADDTEIREEILEAARKLKRTVYGKRIVIFAPLYIGNHCVNDCAYCAFRRSNKDAVRKTLSREEIVEQITFLENKGHKRLILVFGEHPKYDVRFMADTVHLAYSTKKDFGEIRRVNINAAPMNTCDYRIV